MEKEIYDIYYDEESDFLEIFFGESSECTANELEKGVFVRRDINTNEIKSVSIINFKKRAGILNRIPRWPSLSP